ncbi:MAG: FG-GAP repeat protein, partial [Myxococcota bacterium]|nr:FG-GAP repeat protein [Myxococcota bacterium]
MLAAGCNAPSVGEHATIGRAAELWDDEQDLVAGDSAELDQFGYSLAVSGDRAIVGAYGDASFRGAAYIFVRENGAWIEEQKLVASDGASGDNFGWSVALSDDQALVGAYGASGYRGAAYVFARGGDGWTEEQKLTVDDGVENDQLGYSVGIDEDTALIGAYGRDANRGAAYVFSKESGTWDGGQKLVAADGLADDDFGYAVAVAGRWVVVGAPGDDHYRGSVYVFESDGIAWARAQKLLATGGAESEQFGNSVSVAGDRALVGAYWSADFRGAAHVFVRKNQAWEVEQTLVASDGDVGHRFGNAVSLVDGRALIGASRYQQGLGAAYV